MMTKRILILQWAIFSSALAIAQIPSAEQLLDKSIKYHDPKGKWSSFNHEMNFTSERPNGPDRKSTVLINNNKGLFKLAEENNDMEIVMDSCRLIPTGKTCDNVKRTRNYYVYLWGLPMKLKDKGTVLDPKVAEEKFEGIDCYVLRVPYEEDIWFFYIDKSSYAMKGYMFYKDEPAKKGEVIKLEEEVLVGNIRIPKKRKWLTTPDLKFLGTDILTSSN